MQTEDVTDRYTLEYHASNLLIAGRTRPSGWLICDWEANDYIRYGCDAIRAWDTRADALEWIEAGTDVYPSAPLYKDPQRSESDAWAAAYPEPKE